MDTSHIAAQLLKGTVACKASEAEAKVPARPGYYAIFIDDPEALPTPFRDRLGRGAAEPIYVGIARKSLRKRLVDQDLRHKGHSTFFRGLGAALGFRPAPGSLAGKRNQQNYKFSQNQASEIVNWINRYLSIRWLEVAGPEPSVEAEIIHKFRPVFNDTHNPEPLAELTTLREHCRYIARTNGPENVT